MSLLDQVTSQLASIELQDEDIAEYITGIVQEESMADEEKKEVISDFLSEATDKSTDTVIDKLLTEWKLMQESKQKNESDKRKKLIEEARAREEERSLKYQEELSSIKQTEQRQLTKEEKEARDKLVRQYGYVADGEEEEEKETDKDRRKGRQPNEGI
ncbi:hypothetical protein BDB01DRAFT_726279 [Pilobolus umbonatus]|nr:hypothetical protein BDB01DRAFT_726279 [Pilobolus umbonatus]